MIKKFYILAILILSSFAFANAQSQKPKYIRVSGYMFDNKTKETLIGATIYDMKSKLGTTNNNYGFIGGKNTLRGDYINISFQ